MDIIEIEAILKKCLDKETIPCTSASKQEWEELENKLGFKFPRAFKIFIDLMSKYAFPGDIYNVNEENNNGNDCIWDIYEDESQYPEWKHEMIPFYGIGNGDYFCISKNDSKIYYFYEDKLKFEKYMDNIEDWIKDLPDFLE